MSYSELLSMIIAIIALLATLYNIRLVVQTFKADHERRKKQATIEYVGQILREARFKIDARFTSKTLTDSELSQLISSPKDYAEWRNALGVFEHLAVGVNAGVYDKNILYRMAGSYITRLYSFVKPYIQVARNQSHPRAYSEFEILALEFESRHKDNEMIIKGDIQHSRV